MTYKTNMFPPTPHAKPIPRAALYTPSPSSASPEPELEERLHAHLARIYSPSIRPISTTTTTTTTTDAPRRASDPCPSEFLDTSAPDEEAQGYAFRLFSTPNAHTATKVNEGAAQRIVIRSPSPPPKDAVGGFVVSHRGRGYYFSDDDATAGRRRREFEEVVVSGEDVLRLSRVKWPGCALPWRVVTLRLPLRHPLSSPTSSSLPLVPLPSFLPSNPQPIPRKRPNKKRRLAQHKTLAAAQALAAAREMSAKEREVAERGKRTRRNRERKVKRKMKGKEKVAKKKDSGDLEGGVSRLETDGIGREAWISYGGSLGLG